MANFTQYFTDVFEHQNGHHIGPIGLSKYINMQLIQMLIIYFHIKQGRLSPTGLPKGVSRRTG